ncbi:MAG: thiolase family protein, partial [Gammaproteobacteria bacterium]|nr:thiolase family protein [Gammaproteobacteria bacterium]
MKMHAYVAGVGMTRFGKQMDKTLKGLAGEAITAALADAGMDKSAIQAAWMGNAAAGVVTGQEMIRGQVALRSIGIGKIPVVNVENACASSSTAFQQACAMITAGLYDVVLACGSEKLFHEDKARSFGAFSSAVDVEDPDGAMNVLKRMSEAAGEPFDAATAGVNRSIFMDIYSVMAKKHMRKYGSTKAHFAMVAAKNSFHGSMNPRAQFQDVMTVADVLAARTVVEPLTLPMCSPIGDGAAAVILVSERKAR